MGMKNLSGPRGGVSNDARAIRGIYMTRGVTECVIRLRRKGASALALSPRRPTT